MLALTHVPSPKMGECQLTYKERQPINYLRTLQQHESYCQMLRHWGADVQVLDVNSDQPDATFLEDTAIVLDEVALLAAMGAESRRCEPAGIEAELRKYRAVRRVAEPATLEGGDVLRVGQTLLVGLSARTNLAGVAALEAVARPYGYQVRPVPVRGCLHLKTACTALPDGCLLVNPQWLEMPALQGFATLRVPEEEPWGANGMLLGERVCLPEGHVATADLVRRRGFTVHTVDLSEFAKAEGGVTCLCLLIGPYCVGPC